MDVISGVELGSVGEIEQYYKHTFTPICFGGVHGDFLL